MDGALKSARSNWSVHASFVQVNYYSSSILSQSYFFSDSIWEHPEKSLTFPYAKTKMIALTNWGKTFSALTMIFKMTNLKYRSSHEPTIITPDFPRLWRENHFTKEFLFFLSCFRLEKINVKTDYLWHSLWMSQKQSYHVENMTKCNLISSS
jgi:hypothetical protein